MPPATMSDVVTGVQTVVVREKEFSITRAVRTVVPPKRADCQCAD